MSSKRTKRQNTHHKTQEFTLNPHKSTRHKLKDSTSRTVLDSKTCDDLIFNIKTTVHKLDQLCKELKYSDTLERVQIVLENEFTSILGYISECTRISRLHKIEGVIFQMIPRLWKTELHLIPGQRIGISTAEIQQKMKSKVKKSPKKMSQLETYGEDDFINLGDMIGETITDSEIGRT